MITDCHVNIWDDDDLSQLWFDQAALSRDKELPFRADADTLHAEMRLVDKAIIFGLKYGETLGVEVDDETTARAVAKYPDKFIGFACANPSRPDVMEKLRHSIETLKLEGVKMGPIYQNFHLSDKRVAPVFAYCQQNNLPITMHMGTTFGRLCPIDYGRPIHVEPVAIRYPDLKLIMAHMGHPWEGECIAIIRKQPNVYADLSALFYRPWQFYNTLMLAQEYGVCHKIFWGTDYPFSRVSESISGLRSVNQFTEGTRLPEFSGENIQRILNSSPMDHWWHSGRH